MKLLMEAEEATLYDLENGYYVTQEHCSWIHQGYRLMIRKRQIRTCSEIFGVLL